MSLKPGWAEAAGQAAGEAERGEKKAPTMGPKRTYIPLLPIPSEQQRESAKRAGARSKESRQVDRALDAALGKV